MFPLTKPLARPYKRGRERRSPVVGGARTFDATARAWQHGSVAVALSEGCRVNHGLFRCKREMIGLCQYCGRPFCGRHGVLLEDSQQICARKVCVAKREDVGRHLAYKGAVLRRNSMSLCGIGGCEEPLAGHCSRCNGYFCIHHVKSRREPYLQNRVRSTRLSSLCGHCWARRPIWLQT